MIASIFAVATCQSDLPLCDFLATVLGLILLQIQYGACCCCCFRHLPPPTMKRRAEGRYTRESQDPGCIGCIRRQTTNNRPSQVPPSCMRIEEMTYSLFQVVHHASFLCIQLGIPNMATQPIDKKEQDTRFPNHHLMYKRARTVPQNHQSCHVVILVAGSSRGPVHNCVRLSSVQISYTALDLCVSVWRPHHIVYPPAENHSIGTYDAFLAIGVCRPPIHQVQPGSVGYFLPPTPFMTGLSSNRRRSSLKRSLSLSRFRGSKS